ncbi:virulence RhuM family protein [Hymenobacter sp. BT594]|uniref:Virulence RhuM family protein n=1 Tax=Hymenobacter guriensis TaxID=2793065 RepID=A0ABS0L643_9BACT|nr:virulence RhuM family protein [Hymenobacter guriensis]
MAQPFRVKHYNLDVIISVGYRVKSLRGTHFRQWATGVLWQYLVQLRSKVATRW